MVDLVIVRFEWGTQTEGAPTSPGFHGTQEVPQPLGISVKKKGWQ